MTPSVLFVCVHNGIDLTANVPKRLTTDAVRRIRDDIEQRVRALLTELTTRS